MLLRFNDVLEKIIEQQVPLFHHKNETIMHFDAITYAIDSFRGESLKIDCTDQYIGNRI